MRLFLLTSLTMLAFAGNSIFNRMALANHAIDPGDFASIRIFAGAVTLLLIANLQKAKLPKLGRLPIAMSLALLVYMIGFSYAYLQLDAGLGALILFGGVQLTMLVGIKLKGGQLLPAQIIGGAIAFFGLVILFLPSELHIPLLSGAMMAAASIGWGIYSLLGREAGAPLPATALNFSLAFPLALIIALFMPNLASMSTQGVILAVLSGALTSGLGYSLWYAILPKLNPAIAATVQLSVPILAMALGVLLLGEAITMRSLISATLVIAGIAIAIWASRS